MDEKYCSVTQVQFELGAKVPKKRAKRNKEEQILICQTAAIKVGSELHIAFILPRAENVFPLTGSRIAASKSD